MTFFLMLIFLAYGSYLNSLAYRLLHLEKFFIIRSFCPSCQHMIAWYDNIPVLSWIYLQAHCRNCQQKISWLYPFIEIITPLILYQVWQNTPTQYFPAYFLFASGLIITIRTDFEQMLISRFATLYLIPCGILAASMHHIPQSITTSIAGSVCGYGMLWLVQHIGYKIIGKESLGQGDLELLAYIGAFTGPFGCWMSVTIGSILGTIISIVYMMTTKKNISLIPFGAFLSFGAIIFILWQDFFIQIYTL